MRDWLEGETPSWRKAYLRALAGTASDSTMTAEDVAAFAVKIADGSEAVLAARAKAREQAAAVVARARCDAIDRAAAQVREVGAYVEVAVGSIYDVESVDGGKARLLRRDSLDGYVRISVLGLVNSDLADPEDRGHFEAAPKQALRGIVTRIRIASLLDCAGDDVLLIWNDDPEDADSVIRDVVIRNQFRPTREAWAKLAAAGIPMMGYDSAAIERGEGA